MPLILKPITLREANEFVTLHHAHHPRVAGCKFSVGCIVERLVGVAIVGRPVARRLDDGWTLEVTRLCTDRTPHVASKLIAAATRAAFAIGARRIISYVLSDEEGTSYRAAGWSRVEDAHGRPIEFGGGEWSRGCRPRGAMKSPIGRKHRWERAAHGPIEVSHAPV
jgi:hypothetical protein